MPELQPLPQFALREREEAVRGGGREAAGAAQEGPSGLQVPAAASEECEAGPE